MEIFKFKRILSFTFIVLLFFTAKGQSDFRPGYITNLNGDTINGLISYNRDKVNAKLCIFKRDTELNKETFTPDQIKSYKFTDGKYFISSTSLNYEFNEIVFLEYLLKGKVSVLYYQDDVKDHFFVVKDTTIIKLDNQYRLTGNPEEDILIQSKPKKYKEQLTFLFQDQPSLFEKIKRINCNPKDLIMITKEYQKLNCPYQECIEYEKRAGGSLKFKFGIFSSVGLSMLSSPPYNMNISDYDETKFLNFNPAFTYEIGATLNMYFDYYGRNRVGLQLSPSLNFVEYKSREERSLAPLLYVYNLNVKYTTLKIPLLLKYSFYNSNRSIIPYFKIGPGAAIYLNQDGTYEYYSAPLISPSNPTSVYKKRLNHVKSSCFYFMAGVGTDIKLGKNLISVGANYEYGYGQLEGFRSDAQIQIGFQF